MPNGAESQGRPGGNENTTQNQQAKLDRDMVGWTRAVAVFTGLLFIASAFSDYFIWAELRDTQTEHLLTREQLRASLALLGVGEAPAIDQKLGRLTLGFVVNFQNIGGTRTSWTHGWASVQYFPDKIPNNLDVSKPYEDVGPPTNNVTAANGRFSIAVGLKHEDLHSINTSDKGIILLWGRAEYATIYSPNKGLPVAFCYIMNPVKQKAAAVSTPAAAPASGSTSASGPQIDTVPKEGANNDTLGVAALFADLSGIIGFTPVPYKPECNYSE